jgi:hypothetical protein
MNSAQAHHEASHSMTTNGGVGGSAATDHAGANGVGSSVPARKPYDYGGNPLAQVGSHESGRLPAFGGSFQPGSYTPSHRKFANPAPLGLSAFALTTFILSLINMRARNVMAPNLVVASAFAYGGLVQLLAGMW